MFRYSTIKKTIILFSVFILFFAYFVFSKTLQNFSLMFKKILNFPIYPIKDFLNFVDLKNWNLLWKVYLLTEITEIYLEISYELKNKIFIGWILFDHSTKKSVFITKNVFD